LVAEKICENGFATLSSVDGGYFGKGIYFTSHILYTLPYIANRKIPAVILSWVIPGNVYPVIEAHDGTDTLLGTALKSGHSAHYVLTNQKGECLVRKENEYYDELVVSQESQITPAYIFQIGKTNFKQLWKDWNRVIPDPVPGRETFNKYTF